MKRKILKKKAGYIKTSKSKRDKTYKGFTYKSRLEKNMAMILDSYKLPINYEAKTFIIYDKEKGKFESYKTTQKNTGEFKDRNKSINKISYTPDFVSDNFTSKDSFIIECKGYPTPEFNLRYRLFEFYCNKHYPNVTLYMPRNLKQCEQTAKLILSKIKNKLL